jgi:hypothetical protein
MPNGLGELFQCDWNIFMAATRHWLAGGNPYGALSSSDLPGAFAYPPTSLTWLSAFVPTGQCGYWLWSAGQVAAWAWMMRRTGRATQAVLLAWSPLFIGLLMGQTTLIATLLLWFVYTARQRGWLCGFLLALVLTKPQTALLPVLWLLWNTRRDEKHISLWSGIVIGTILLALPPTLRDPGIWSDWIASLSAYGKRNQQSFPWEGFGLLILLPAAWLWLRKTRVPEKPLENIWPWWLTMALFPQASPYPAVVLLPIMRPSTNYWGICGLALSAMLIGPASSFFTPIILSGQILAAWMINGGPRSPRIQAGGNPQ